jgi:DNA modification methylase
MINKEVENKLILGDNLEIMRSMESESVDLTFLDPPFNQQKEYACFDDNMPEEEYWKMMQNVCKQVYDLTVKGGCIYFMQREKNSEFVLNTLRESGWSFQNLIIWRKQTSAVPVKGKYGKQFQIIVYAVKGSHAKTFNRLRINPPVPNNYKIKRENGIYVTDVWDDIREMTSGYFAGDEAIRTIDGERFHKQQTSIALLLRIILSSTNVGDTVLDPYSGTGTTAVTAFQLLRNSISIEIDPQNVKCIENRLNNIRAADNIQKYYQDYICTENLQNIWGNYYREYVNQDSNFGLFKKIV